MSLWTSERYTAMELSLFILFALFIGLTAADCDTYKMLDCIADISQPPLSTEPAAFDQFCQDVSAASSCIDNVPCSPTDSDYDLWRSTIGMIDLYDGYLCRSDVRQIYLRDGQCAENVSFSAEGQRCTSASQDDTQSTSPETQCRGWNTLIPCMYEATKSQCGQEVANIVVTGYEKLFAAILPNCTVVFDEQTSSIATTSSPLMTSGTEMSSGTTATQSPMISPSPAGDASDDTSLYAIIGAGICILVVIGTVLLAVLPSRTSKSSSDLLAMSAERGRYQHPA